MRENVLKQNVLKQNVQIKNCDPVAGAEALKITHRFEDSSATDISAGGWPEIGQSTFQRLYLALQVLISALEHAQQLKLDQWEFAEEISGLRQFGLSNSDLRWLVCRGFVNHGHEVTQCGQSCREFVEENGLFFTDETCFVLTVKGAFFFEQYRNDFANIDPSMWLQTAAIEPEKSVQPEWDHDLHELRVGDNLVKQFKVPACNQETILDVFQEENWPVYIDDPLPQHAEIDPKRRLHDTINSLNRCQKQHLIQFRGNGTGQGIRWEFFNFEESAAQSTFSSSRGDQFSCRSRDL